jgi:hypothetical protein
VLCLAPLSACAVQPARDSATRTSNTQSQDPPPMVAPDRQVGRASLHVDARRNEVSASAVGTLVEDSSGPEGIVSLDMMAICSNNGTVLETPAAIDIHFSAVTKRPLLSATRTLTMVVAGKAAATGRTQVIKSECQGGTCQEGVRGPDVPLAVVEQMVASDRTELRFDSVVIELGPDMREALHDLIALVRSTTP